MEQGQDTKMKNSVDYVKAIEGGVQPSQVTTFSAERELLLNSSNPLGNLYLLPCSVCVNKFSENQRSLGTLFSDLFFPQAIETKVYKRRWLVLMIFVLYSASNAMQWIQYSIIANIIMVYYNVSSFSVDMTSMIYMITYIPFIFPASYLLDRFMFRNATEKGLRFAALAGAIGTTLGSWIKVFSVSPDRFWITFLGQSLVALSQTFILSVPARLAAVWFGPDQVSSACSIGVFGNQRNNVLRRFQLGIAIGFLFPPMLVENSENINVIGQGLHVMFYIVAAFTTIILVLILLFFKSEPPLPPSPAQAVQREAESTESFFVSVKKLVTNYHEKDAGRIGLTIVCAGMLGSVVCGIVLDKTHKFKETTLGVYLLSFFGMIIFTFTLDSSQIYVIYMTAGMLGFFMTGYLPVGFEFAAELTYPEPEGTSAGLLNAVCQVFGIVFTIVYGYMLGAWRDFWANIFLCATKKNISIFQNINSSEQKSNNSPDKYANVGHGSRSETVLEYFTWLGTCAKEISVAISIIVSDNRILSAIYACFITELNSFENPLKKKK
ncbi:putative MFS-type transporter C09D4.1 [Melipona quadrifasciata]|uniref:Putative MFS-type transporter C09D4.1 n=1 Tax=Melipona quadrifasciata TaxID=166423 RepID=A0A0M9AC30_9HYME|nr:putative MFS-type transporter C09D4.1 [Melipona quadrifasciata]